MSDTSSALLSSDPGLSPEAVQERLHRFGHNHLVPASRGHGLWHWFLKAVADPMAVLLLVAGGTYLVVGDKLDAIVALAALIPITAVTIVLEFRAERTLEQLKRMTAPTAEVWRDGARTVVPAEELVPDDLLFVREGEVLPADGDLVEGQQVIVDESALTGESIPLTKDAKGERELYAGTTVRAGHGIARITATGPGTRYGKIGELLSAIDEPPTPLQRTIHRLVLRLGIVAAFFCVAVFIVELAHGAGLGAAVIAGVSLGIAAIPEEFPMVFTLYLSLGAWRLARDRALVRRLAGVETLGSTTVICSDKTGTLTLGRVDVAATWVDGTTETVGGEQSETALGLLRASVMASERDPFDPLEQAIVATANDAGLDVTALHGHDLVHDYPFDPEHKYMCHVWEHGGSFGVYAKGAPEGVLHQSGASDEVVARVLEANRDLAKQGMRLIGVASGVLEEATGDRSHDEAPLEFAGLLAFSDPPRPGVAQALKECMEAGIRVVMITGDHPVTARAVAEGLGLRFSDDSIATGEDLDAADDEQLDALVSRASIFARTRPEQKHRLVVALKRAGEVVAMTGDGVNDAPALREADIGVAMGERGTDVARAAATMVLLDDNFATIVAAVKDGRRIFDNLRRAFSYLVAFHAPLLLSALLVPLTGHPLLLLPIQLVWLELIVHPTASLVFEADPPDEDLMERPPRKPGSGLLAKADVLGSVVQGLSLSAGVIGLYLVSLDSMAVGQARAVAFAAMVVGQTFLVMSQRSPGRPAWRTPLAGNKAILPVVVATLATLPLLMYLGPLADAMHFSAPDASGWVTAIAVGLVSTVWMEFFKRRA